MATIFIPNFDFEHQLIGDKNYQRKPLLKRINQELMWAWLSQLKDGDFLLTEEAPEEFFLESLKQQGLPVPICVSSMISDDTTYQPWGWSDQLELKGLKTFDHPSIEAVRLVNSRSYSHQLEQDWEIGIPGAIQVENVSMLENHLDNHQFHFERWAIKSEFAMSGRERIVGTGREISEQETNWIEKRIRSGQNLYFEPWVQSIEEAGLQFSIPPKGEPVLEGVTPLVSTSNGGYQGSLISKNSKDEHQWKDAIEWGFKAALKIQADGYWGPLGIDAMIYEDHHHKKCIRSIQDINARWTMGRCALGFRKYLNDSEEAFFFHLVRTDMELNSLKDQLKIISDGLQGSERILQLSPWLTSGIPNRLLMFLIVSSDRKRIHTIAEEMNAIK